MRFEKWPLQNIVLNAGNTVDGQTTLQFRLTSKTLRRAQAQRPCNR